MMTIRHRQSRRQVLQWGVLALGGVATACRSAAGDSSNEGVATTPRPLVETPETISAATTPTSSTSAATEPTAEVPATLVLIHGAWHRPGPTWSLVSDRLEREGITSVAVALPSADPENDQRPGLADDVRAVTAAIDAIDGPVVLVGHSYGGMVVSGAGSHPAVRSLVYLAAFCLEEGETVLDIAAVDPPPLIASAIRFNSDGLMTIDPKLAKDVFYADVPDSLARSSVDALVASTAAIFTTPQARPAWKDKRSWYVVCEQDQAIPVFKEHEMSTRCDESVVLQSSHSPFLSMPDRVAELLADVARFDA
jgi:pimeloyl-ACP methyl ester carboxylesterase